MRHLNCRPTCILVLAVLMVIGLVAPAGAAFTDLAPSAPAYPYIRYLAEKQLVSGYPDGSYRPANTVTRAEMAALLVRAERIAAVQPAVPTFRDVAPGHWAYGVIEAAAAAGVVSGYPDGTFRPGAPVTRAETAALLVRLSKEPLPYVPLPAVVLDVAHTHWAAAPVAAALDAGVLTLAAPSGFAPDAPATRSQVGRGLAVTVNLDPARLEVPLVGLLVPLEGAITLDQPGRAPFQVTGSVNCGAGVAISTGPGSRAEVRLPDGSGVLLDSNTTLAVTQARGQATILRDGTPGAVVDLLELDLKKGRLYGALAPTEFYYRHESVVLAASEDASGRTQIPKVQPEAEKLPWWKRPFAERQRVKVNMPWGVAGVRGTFWMNEVGPNGETTSVVYGAVEVTAGGETVLVTPGLATTVSGPNSAPGIPAPMTTDQQLAWLAVQDWVVQRTIAMEQSAPLIALAPKVEEQSALLAGGAVAEELEAPPPVFEKVIESFAQSTPTFPGAPLTRDEKAGGGGSGGGGVDTTPPRVAGGSLADKETGVPVETSLFVYFSEPVLQGNTFGAITLLDSSNNTVGADRYLAGQTLYLVPHGLLAADTWHTVRIPAGAVRDQAGNALAHSYTFTFRTGSGQVNPPGQIKATVVVL